MSEIDRRIQEALLLHRQGNLLEAGKIYRQVLRKRPDNALALHYLGAIEAATGSIAQAKSLMSRSIAAAPHNLLLVQNYATLLCRTGDFEAALQVCRHGLLIDKTSPILLFNNALALRKTGQLPDALRQFDTLLTVQSGHLGALNERGSVLAEMKNYEAALESFDRALEIHPDFADAHINKGTVYWTLERYEEATDCYERAVALNPRAAVAWLGLGNIHSALKRYSEALAAYDMAIEGDTNLADAWLARGNLHFTLTSYERATADIDRALAINPDLSEAWLGKGNVLFVLRLYEDALLAYEKAQALKPNLASAWFGCGNVLEGLKRYREAITAYERAISLNAKDPGLESSRLRVKLQLCDWRDFDDDCARLLSSGRSGKLVAYPFELLSLPSSPEDQHTCAAQWIARQYPASEAPLWRGERYSHRRIRVAYVSADFRPHPVAFLIASMLEHHDRSRFEVTGVSLGPPSGSDLRLRLEKSFERFLDAGAKSDREIAESILEREIDILVNLNGLTGGERTGIFAKRCAPIQVNYLGYPGTMGARYMDYILADRIVIPENLRLHYTEKVACLPHSFMVNDARLAISDVAPSRQDVGLRSGDFVFCCFNNNYKITPRLFDCWMRLLGNVESSVLWLANDDPEAARNLRGEAAARGIEPDRLVFAERVPALADHLARLGLADLFLDTLPYNAHATACHALWAGVPVLTCLGETFAGRVGASLLQAIHLPELVTTTLQAYEALAIELAQHPAKLQVIRNKLAANRLTTPLFDTRHFTENLEAAYLAMYERHLAGSPPEHFSVPQLVSEGASR